MGTLKATSTFCLDMAISYTWEVIHKTSTVWTYGSVYGGSTGQKDNKATRGPYTLTFDISALPANTTISNIKLVFPWTNTTSWHTFDLTATVGETIKSLPSSQGADRIIIFDSLSSDCYTIVNNTLSITTGNFIYTGPKKPSNTIERTPTAPAPAGSHGGWWTGYNPNATGSKGYESTQVYVEITYTQNYAKLPAPTNLILSKNPCLSSDETVSLSWSASIPTSTNGISKYEVYRNNVNIGNTTATETSFTIRTAQFPTTGGTANFSVKAISDNGGAAYNSDFSSNITLKCYGTINAGSLGFYTNKNSTKTNKIYLGSSDTTTQITLTCSATYAVPTYDSLSAITYKYGDTVLQEGTKKAAIPNLLGAYSVIIAYSSGRSQTFTNTVYSLDAPAKVSFTSQPAEGSGKISDVQYTWSTVTGASSYVYTTHGLTADTSGVISTNTYTLPIASVPLGGNFYISVRSRAYSSYGGYAEQAGQTSTTAKRIAPIGTIDVTIAGITGRTEAPITNDSYTYNKTRINWSYKVPTGGGKLQTINYNIDGGSSKTLSIGTSVSYDDTAINSFAAGSHTYNFIFTDEYGLTKIITKSITKIAPPKITIDSLTAATKDSATLGFTIEKSAATANYTDIKYQVSIGYGNQTYQETEKSLTSSATGKYQVQLSALDISKLTTLQSKLFPTSGNPLGTATISYQIFAYDENFPVAKGNSASTTKLIDFMVVPTISGNLTISNGSNNKLSYASSLDTIQITRPTSSASITIGAITTSLNNYIASIMSRNGVILSGNGDTVPKDTAEANWTYTYTASIEYIKENNTKEIKSASCSSSYTIHEWRIPVLSLVNLQYASSSQIRGNINSSLAKWGGWRSTNNTDGNISKIEMTFSGFDSTQNISIIDAATLNADTYSLIVNNQTEKERDISVVVTITSTGGHTYTINIPAVKLKPVGIPFAIRQYGIGTNIAKSWNVTKTDPALQIIGNQTSTVATFSNGLSQQTTDIMLTNDATSNNVGKARLSLNKDDETNWTLSIFFD